MIPSSLTHPDKETRDPTVRISIIVKARRGGRRNFPEYDNHAQSWMGSLGLDDDE
ncbi:MAG: hypothetical protein N2C14_26620 [Planctomycetales bacterium]